MLTSKDHIVRLKIEFLKTVTGLTLTVMIGFLADYFIKQKEYEISYILGSLIEVMNKRGKYDPCIEYTKPRFMRKAVTCLVYKNKYNTMIIGTIQNSFIGIISIILESTKLTGEALVKYALSVVRLFVVLITTCIAFVIVLTNFASFKFSVGFGKLELDTNQQY